jgi:3-methylcrotonyl-CoA carboxylase alpha subunit
MSNANAASNKASAATTSQFSDGSPIMEPPLFTKVLVANRGEIAVRIIRGLRDMGIIAVALASEPDRDAEHVRVADEVIFLPGRSSAETYLQGAKIIALAKAAGIQAIHPGYGFLSENADFAQACADANLTFIGPAPSVMREMGDKIRAKALMEKAGVPVVPGWAGEADATIAVVREQANRIGYPLLVKAAAGGGGKGMRLVHVPEELEAAWHAAAREAQSAFGDARVFLERYITRPRHIEFQIFGDHYGQLVHLFERECSIQRRHQKLIEEAPSPALMQNPELRARMGEAALKAAKAMAYTNAGTIEFIVDDAGNFYFLEVNTRLQVEHPITEWTVQQDLVRLQLLIAAGKPLPFTQADLQQHGHAIECRICAEDPAHGFMPATGRLAFYRPPQGPFIRVDSGVREGSEITVHYDPLLAKLIVWGPDRTAALSRMSRALSQFVALGMPFNAPFLKTVIDHPDFQAGNTHTHFLAEHDLPAKAATDPSGQATNTETQALLVGGLSNAITQRKPSTATSQSSQREEAALSPWNTSQTWRAGACR